MSFLAVKKEELNGVQPDFIYVTGEAYCDHPSFGTSIIPVCLSILGLLLQSFHNHKRIVIIKSLVCQNTAFLFQVVLLIVW